MSTFVAHYFLRSSASVTLSVRDKGHTRTKQAS